MTVIVSAVVCLPAAYSFARLRFPGRRALLIGLFATNAFPKMGLFVTIASLCYAFNLMQTVLGILVVHVIGTVVFMTWIPAVAFASVPRSLEDVARDAGAGPVRVFATVTLPLAMPGDRGGDDDVVPRLVRRGPGHLPGRGPTSMTVPTQMDSLVPNYPKQVAAVFSIMLAIPSVILMLLVRQQVMGGRLAEGFQIR